MSDAKFTPGPWRLISSKVHVVSSGDHPTVICRTGFAASEGDESQSTRERWEADAQLIAAAPELYAALDKCARHLFTVGNDDLAEPAIAALKKARGEQT